jgi:methyltransferase-like protein/2-polyprenyl-3-methyl-5-hydroxy-6-metoxy-1,4-benzoquinol methylase
LTESEAQPRFSSDARSGHDRAASSYDEVPYSSKAIEDTHPDRLSTMSALFGHAAPEISRCRVLELGCGRGVNLMSMATTLPQAQFLGVDASARQIEDGRRRVEAAGLTNVDLRPADLLEIGPEIGEFDYIVCHGVYSWVARNVADRILELVRRHLAADGVAYVSYNTYPGWFTNRMLREMMLFHTRALADPRERTEEARRLIHLLARHAKEEEGTYREVFQMLAAYLDTVDDSYFFHEYLEENNEPVFFAEFARRVREAGLEYLAPARFEAWEQNLPPEVARPLKELSDRVVRQQYLDYLSNRRFGRTLLCHPAVAIRDEPSADAVRDLFLRARGRPESPEPDVLSTAPEAFGIESGARLTTNRPLVKAALVELTRLAPRFLGYRELRDRVLSRGVPDSPDQAERDLPGLLLSVGRSGFLTFSKTPPPFAVEVPERPRASALARLQAAGDEPVSSLTHQTIRAGSLDRFLLRQLDGTRDQADLQRILVEALASGNYSVTVGESAPLTDPEALRSFAADSVPDSLRNLAASCLLMT